jgi:hypothetical protein
MLRFHVCRGAVFIWRGQASRHAAAGLGVHVDALPIEAGGGHSVAGAFQFAYRAPAPASTGRRQLASLLTADTLLMQHSIPLT